MPATDEVLNAKLTEQMGEIYNIVGICLGIPAATFKWEYYDKTKAYKSTEEVSAVDFYEKYVKQCFDVDDKVSLHLKWHTFPNYMVFLLVGLPDD